MIVRVVLKVTELPTKEEMKRTAMYIWEKQNKSWDSFTVFMYLPGMATRFISYGIGEFGPSGLKEFKVQDFALSGTRWKPLKQKEEKQPIITQKQVVDEKLPGILSYRIVKKQDISYANTPRMVYRVVLDVTDIPSEIQMKRTASYIWENGNKHWKEFTVFMYLPGMNTSGAALGIGEFRPYGLKEFKVQGFVLAGTKWEEKAEQYLKLSSKIASEKRKEIEKETGPILLPAEMKKKIYREFVDDPLWAYDDGTDKIPLKLGEKYMKKYNLTRLQLAVILAEGAEKGW